MHRVIGIVFAAIGLAMCLVIVLGQTASPSGEPVNSCRYSIAATSTAPGVGKDYLNLWNGSARTVVGVVCIRVVQADGGHGLGVPLSVVVSKTTTQGVGCAPVPLMKWDSLGDSVDGLVGSSNCATHPIVYGNLFGCSSVGTTPCFTDTGPFTYPIIVRPGEGLSIIGTGTQLPSYPVTVNISFMKK